MSSFCIFLTFKWQFCQWQFKLGKNENFWQFFWKKCQVFGNFLTFRWQFSGGSGDIALSTSTIFQQCLWKHNARTSPNLSNIGNLFQCLCMYNTSYSIWCTNGNTTPKVCQCVWPCPADSRSWCHTPWDWHTSGGSGSSAPSDSGPVGCSGQTCCVVPRTSVACYPSSVIAGDTQHTGAITLINCPFLGS